MAMIKNKKTKKTMTSVKKREVKHTPLYTMTGETDTTSSLVQQSATEQQANTEPTTAAATVPATEDTDSKAITIYVVGKFKRTDAQGCYGISIYKQGKRKPENHSGCFESTLFAEAQLKTLCHAISLIENPFDYSVIEIVTDFSIGDKFSSGLVTEWKNKGWVSTVKKPITNADLYSEFLALYQDYAITFTTPEPKDKKFLGVQTVLEQEIKAMNKAAKKQEPHHEKRLVQESPSSHSEDVAEDKSKIATPVTMQESSIAESAPVLETVATSQIVAQSTPQTETVAIHVDHKLMSECEVLFEQMGLDVDTAVTMLLKQALRNKGLSVQL